MAITTTREAPFDQSGNLMHYARPGSWPHAEQWRVVEPWRAVMRVDEGVTSGRSAKYVHVVDSGSHRWPLFITDLVKLLRARAIDHGRVQTCANDRWYVAKRGQNFGVSLILCEEVGCPW